MGPAVSLWISRVLRYSGFQLDLSLDSCTGLSPPLVDLSRSFYFSVGSVLLALLPRRCRNIFGLGSSAFARHYLRNHCYFLFLRVIRCFSSPRSLTLLRVYQASCLMGCPIRISTGQRIFAPLRSFSQLITSFVAVESLGILHAPLLSLCVYSWRVTPPSYRFLFYLFQLVKELWSFAYSLWRITDSNR